MRKALNIGSKEIPGIARAGMQLLVYAVFVFAYYFLVLHFMGSELKRLYDDHKAIYAAVALVLITAQGVLLEIVTGWLFTAIRWGEK